MADGPIPRRDFLLSAGAGVAATVAASPAQSQGGAPATAATPPADLILIEGFKHEPHPKIEVRSDEDGASAPPLAPKDAGIVAVAADQPPADQRLPWFRRDDIAGIADFIAGLNQR